MEQIKKFFLFLVIIFAFLSVFKPLTKVNATSEEDKFVYLQYGWLVNGLYYSQYTDNYMWVSSEDILDSSQIEIYIDFEDTVYTVVNYFEYFRLSYDFSQINPYGSSFIDWWREHATNIIKLREAGYFFYLIQGGVNIPPVSSSKMLKIKIYDNVVPIFSFERISDIINFIDYLKTGVISEEDLLREFSRGYDVGYSAGQNAGYNVGYSDGYNDGVDVGRVYGYNEGYSVGRSEGYNIGYNDGINAQLEDKDFTHLLKSVFIGIGSFLGINLLPGISIGALIAVPIVFGIISFIIGKRKD